MVVEDADDEADQTLDNHGITVAGEVDEVRGLVVVGLNPYAALAAFDEVLRRLVLLGEGFQIVAQLDEHLIFVHPVVEGTEVLDNLILCFVYCCHNKIL